MVNVQLIDAVKTSQERSERRHREENTISQARFVAEQCGHPHSHRYRIEEPNLLFCKDVPVEKHPHWHVCWRFIVFKMRRSLSPTKRPLSLNLNNGSAFSAGDDLKHASCEAQNRY